MPFITNIDTFIYSLDIENYEVSASEMINQLKAAKMNSKLNEEKDVIELRRKKTDLSFTLTFDVFPNGAQFHSFIISNDSYNIKLAEFRSKNKENYPVMIRVSSEALWSLGLKKAVVQINEMIETNFGKIKATKVSRADLCCHIDEFDFQNFQLDYFIGRYREDSQYRQDRKTKAFYFGSKQAESHFCRIYSKSLEISIRKSKSWFHHIWQSQEMDINEVWNIEFECKRKFFKSHEIETLDEFWMKLNDIWRYLMKDWMNINIKENSFLDGYHELWNNIAMIKFNEHEYSGLSRYFQKETSAAQMIPQLIGVITSYTAKNRQRDIDQCLDEIINESRKYLRSKKDITVDELIDYKIHRLVTG